MVLNWLFARQQQPDLGHLQFTIYTRQGCHLCDSAWGKLQTWQRRHRFAIETVDIDGDPELQAKYGDQVPVVAVNGKVRFKGCVNEVLLKRLLEAEANHRRAGSH
jgi:glutaredoxin